MSGDRIYHMDDAVLELPPGFIDRSVHVLEWRTPDGEAVVLVTQREPLPGTRPLADYVAQETKDYATRFEGYRAEEPPRDGAETALEALHRTFRWKRNEDVLYNHQVFVAAPPVVLVMTVTGKAAHREDVDRLVGRALADLKFREA